MSANCTETPLPSEDKSFQSPDGKYRVTWTNDDQKKEMAFKVEVQTDGNSKVVCTP